MNLLEEADLVLKLMKCVCFTNQIVSLDHVIKLHRLDFFNDTADGIS